MCGILGIGGPRGGELTARLLYDLRHRGPDDEGVWDSPVLSLGHRRLAIIGLDPGGRQPRVAQSGKSVLSFNGEIYNYLEIADDLEAAGYWVDRRYDTSVLLEALEAWGTDVLPRLNGMFAFAWYRPQERRLLLARDRWGKKPLFWGRAALDDGSTVLVFSSELRTFARLPGGPPPPDPLGVVRYLVYDGMPDTRTIYRGVSKVAAAHWLELDPEGTVQRSERYWSFDSRPSPADPETAVDELRERLQRALALRLRSDVPVGLLLSGGIDSSVLAALWRQVRPGAAIHTFTVGFEEPSYDERGSARQMAEAIGATHHEIVAGGAELETELDWVSEHLPEPFADPSIVPTSLVCRFAGDKVRVALGGDGADELQAGYDPFRAWKAARIMESLLPRRLTYGALKALEAALPLSEANMNPRFRVHHLAQGFLYPPEERVQGWMASFSVCQALGALKPELAAEVDMEEVLLPSRRAFAAARSRGALYAQIRTWAETYMECCILTKVDRASMMHSLEVRAPFLDPDVASFLWRLPPQLVFHRGRGKRLLHRLAGDLLPRQLLSKPKKGLGVPQASWLRTVLRPRMEEALDKARTGGWFDHAAMTALWQRHHQGRDDHRRSLWNFLFAAPFQ